MGKMPIRNGIGFVDACIAATYMPGVCGDSKSSTRSSAFSGRGAQPIVRPALRQGLPALFLGLKRPRCWLVCGYVNAPARNAGRLSCGRSGARETPARPVFRLGGRGGRLRSRQQSRPQRSERIAFG